MDKKIGKRRGLMLLLAATLLSLNAGCLFLAAGAAAGGAATYIYYKGRLCQEYPATFPEAWQAVQQAVKELGYQVTSQQNEAATGKITAEAKGKDTVTLELTVTPSPIPSEKSIVRVCVRVGVLGDEPASERILKQIGTHLAPPPPAGGAPAKLGPIQQAKWTSPSETAPPPELPKK